VKEISETKSIRISRDLWAKLQKAVTDHDFNVQDLVEWILSNVDLDEYVKKLASKAKSEVETEIETKKEDEQEAEEEETSTDEEDEESADDEAENFGKY
jgi:ribosomal protein L12E/L44/L45/RPP1/RPP2